MAIILRFPRNSSIWLAFVIAFFLATYSHPAFADDPIHDPGILDLAARIAIVPGDAGWGAGLSIALRDGRRISGTIASFRGCPETPMSLDEVAAKFRRLTRHRPGMDGLVEVLLDMENVRDITALEL